ncbi:MAG: GrdX family protein [Oscillospiraceae bacterium]|nr:GrdX family protein [Oscillospiraceae bacterium]
MANFCIITNNPMVMEKYPCVTTLLDTSVEGVFRAARDEIHLGAALVNHPLSGSVKPNESPYKSLVLAGGGGPVDFASLRLIEGAKEVLDKLPPKNRRYSKETLEDFMVIDLDLLNSAVSALPARYHMVPDRR